MLRLIVFLWFVSFFCAPGAIHAQVAGGSISGTVKRASQGAMPGIHVTIRETTTDEVRNVVTNIDGLYNAPGLPAGNYDVTVSASGFVTQVWTGVTVAAGGDRVLNVVLQPGNSQKIVRREAPVAPVSQASGCCGGSVNSAAVRNTPLNGRDWAQLATLQAGVTGVQSGTSTGAGAADRGFGAAISISGARPDQNSYRLDGISINDYSNGAPGSVLGDNLGIDAVQQVSVLGSNYPAEYGRTSGGVINAVTRSGTNAFHGDIYEFFRNSGLDARNYFDGPVIPPFHRNQFGASAGGPIRKNRTFIFGDYEGLRQSLGVTTVDTVPSPAARLGHIHDAQGNPITVAVDPAVASFLNAFYPSVNGPLLGNGDTGIFSFAGQQATTENYFTTRVDNKFSDKDSLEGTYMHDSSETVQPDSFDEQLTNVISRRQTVTLHEEHIFSPSVINAARLGYNRAVAIEGGVTAVLNQKLLDPSFAFQPGGLVGGVNAVPGVTDFRGGPIVEGNSFQPNRSLYWNSFQAGDDVYITHGIHAIKFGVDLERMQSNQQSFFSFNGTFRFSSLENFLTNQPLVFQGTRTPFTPVFGLRQTLFGAYVQDDIRLRPDLTVNAGLRYEFVTVPTEAHNLTSVLLNLTDAKPQVGGPLFHNPTLRNFEPRVGFAWNPRGGGWLVRSGFGIFDVLPLPYVFNLSFQHAVPFAETISASTLPAGSFPTGAYQDAQTTAFTAYYTEQHPKRSYVMQWNLNIARELSSTMSLTVGYVGSHGLHLPYRMDNIDMVLPTLTPSGYLFPPTATSQTLNPNFGRINATLWQASSFYDAMQVTFTKRVSHGIQFNAAYTWGKSIDTLSATVADDAFPNGLFNQLFFDQRTSRGLSDFNVAQNLVVSFTWAVPAPAWSSAFPHWATSGWQLLGLYKASTGQPFTPILGGDPVGMKLDETSEPPNRLGGPGCSTLTNPGDPNHYIKTQCLAFPVPSNLWGNLGRNALIGPGQSKLDLSIFKNNVVRRVSETFNVQFRVEIFNIFNRPNFASPTGNLTVFDQNGAPVSSAGLITSTQTTSRQIQLAVKMIW